MKKNLRMLAGQLTAVCLLLSSGARAQDVVYFDDGTSVPNTRITNVLDEKVVLTVLRDGNIRVVPFSRSKILLAFTKAGNYLLVSELSTDSIQARQQLATFLSAPPRTDGNDYLIKAVPTTIIPARIVYDNDEIVNYKTPGGDAASISKSELVAILYKDGHHALITQAADAAPMLAEIKPGLMAIGKPVVDPTPARQPEPQPVQSRVDAAATPARPVSAQPVPQPATPDPGAVAGTARLLTDEEKETYRQKSLFQVDKFLAYISAITDKDNSSTEKDLAIEEAMKLFINPDSTTIEVTSSKRLGTRMLSLRQYLIRLKLLPYKYTRVEWAEAKFVRDLTLEKDGNYYGTITGRQVFTGFGANGQSQYSDVTDKNVRVKLESYKKIIDNTDNVKWRVLLGNIRVGSD